MAKLDEKHANATAENSGSTKSVSADTVDRQLDYGDLKNVWKGLLDSKRNDAESNLLRITARVSKLDPIAEAALNKVKQQFNTDEAGLRQLISRKGWATELAKVNKRINGMRISDNKRLVLAKVYPNLLNKLLKCNISEESIKDDLSMTNDILFELERQGGPLDVFAQEIVRLTGSKHRIHFPEDNVLRDLVAHQIRSGL